MRMARMIGLALQERLTAMGAHIPIVFISSHGDAAIAVKAVKDRAVDFVQKPYRDQQLLDAADDALRRDASRPGRPPKNCSMHWPSSARRSPSANGTS
jgi:FixJ family two-component response regulator